MYLFSALIKKKKNHTCNFNTLLLDESWNCRVASDNPSGGKVIERPHFTLIICFPFGPVLEVLPCFSTLPSPTPSSSQHILLKFPPQRTHQTQHRLQRCECNGIYVNGRVKLVPKLLVSRWKKSRSRWLQSIHLFGVMCDERVGKIERGEDGRGGNIHISYFGPVGPK